MNSGPAWKRVCRSADKGPDLRLATASSSTRCCFRAKTGVPWRDLPERFGPWKSIYNRFANWADRGVWELIFKELQIEFDEVGSIIDGTVVRAHQDASGGRGGSNAMLWAALEEGFHRSFTPSSTRKAVRSTSR